MARCAVSAALRPSPARAASVAKGWTNASSALDFASPSDAASPSGEAPRGVEISPDGLVPRLQLEGALEVGQRLLDPALVRQDSAEIRVRGCVRGRNLDRAQEVRDRLDRSTQSDQRLRQRNARV